MANAVVSKFMNMFGMGAAEEEPEEGYEEDFDTYQEEEEEELEPRGLFGRKK